MNKRELTTVVFATLIITGATAVAAGSVSMFLEADTTSEWDDKTADKTGVTVDESSLEVASGATHGTWNSSTHHFESNEDLGSIRYGAAGGFSNWTKQENIASNDIANPQLIIDQDAPYTYRVLVSNGTDNDTEVYGTDDLQSGDWTKVHDGLGIDLDGDGQDEYTSGIDAGTKVNGTYYFTGGKWTSDGIHVLKGDSLTNLTDIGPTLNENQLELFYDEETGVWHSYFEDNPGAFGCCSGTKIGHATAPSPTGPWTDQGDIYDTGGDHGVGDPEMIQVGDYYYLFADNTTNHPYYYQDVLRTKNLNATTWNHMGRVTTDYGGDADIRYDPQKNQFVMVNEYDEPPNEVVGFRTSPGPFNGDDGIQVRFEADMTGDGTLDTQTQYHTGTPSYSFDASDQQKISLSQSVDIPLADVSSVRVTFNLTTQHSSINWFIATLKTDGNRVFMTAFEPKSDPPPFVDADYDTTKSDWWE